MVKEVAKEFAIGCVGHFLIALAAAVLLGGAASYFGLRRGWIFAIVVLTIFVVSVLIPSKGKPQ